MGDDKVRYLVFIHGRWRWRPTRTMRAAGFRLITLGPGTTISGKRAATDEEKARALRLNAEWDKWRRGSRSEDKRRRFPHGSVGDAFERAMLLREAERHAKGVEWSNEQRSRDDWPRAWKWIE